MVALILRMCCIDRLRVPETNVHRGKVLFIIDRETREIMHLVALHA